MSKIKRKRKRSTSTVQHAARHVPSDGKAEILERTVVLLRAGRYAESEACSREALRIWADDVDILNELGAAVWRQGRHDEAEAIFRQAHAISPEDFRILNNLGLALYQQGLIAQAGDFYRLALRSRDDSFDARMNLGVVYSDQGQLDLAMDWFRRAQELRPDSVEILENIAANMVRQGRAVETIPYYEQILRSRPDCSSTHVNLAYALLCAGEYERGWREYEWRLKREEHPGFRVNRPFWNGEDIRNRTILLHAEQGNGDNLQFIRFAANVKKCAGFVLARCSAPLLKLIARCNGVDMAYEGSSFEPNCHVHAPLMSLPAILGITLQNLPAQVPYLVVDKLLVDHWGDELDKATTGDASGGEPSAENVQRAQGRRPFRIGIVWQGNPAHFNDRWRSFRLANFAAIAQLPGVCLISLQAQDGLDELKSASLDFPVIQLAGRKCLDFMETAAIMTHLDLVITPDSAMAHLAGGLGVRTWTALSTVNEWRWLTGRDDSPWYPTMRLFRQSKIGEWRPVFDRMADELKRELGAVAVAA